MAHVGQETASPCASPQRSLCSGHDAVKQFAGPDLGDLGGPRRPELCWPDEKARHDEIQGRRLAAVASY
jgi:hypothetical protein